MQWSYCVFPGVAHQISLYGSHTNHKALRLWWGWRWGPSTFFTDAQRRFFRHFQHCWKNVLTNGFDVWFCDFTRRERERKARPHQLYHLPSPHTHTHMFLSQKTTQNLPKTSFFCRFQTVTLRHVRRHVTSCIYVRQTCTRSRTGSERDPEGGGGRGERR